MKIFFSPAIKLIDSLKYKQKLILISFIAILAITILVYQFVMQSLDILAFSQKELVGVKNINPMITVMQKMQEYRTLSTKIAAGDQQAKNQLMVTKTEVDKAMKVVDEEITQSANILEIKNEWDGIKSEWFLVTKQTSNANFTPIISNLQKLMITACDASNLTLDPDINTYYLMDTYCKQIPSFIEEAALIHDIGIKVLAAKAITTDDREQLLLQQTLIDALSRTSIEGNLEKVLKASPELNKTFNPLLVKLSAEANDVTQLLDNTLLENKVDIAQDVYTGKLNAVINTGYKVYSETEINLANLIQVRVNLILSKLYFNLTISIVSLIVMIYLFFGVYFSIINSILTLVRGSEKLASGDLANTVELQTQDELVQVATSFNIMRDTLSKIINEAIYVLENVSKGNLTEKINGDYPLVFGDLKNYINTTVESLEKLIRNIKVATETINHAAEEISQGNNELAKRTEQQAAFLEETAASIEEVTTIGKQNAANAKQANLLAQSTSDVAVKGGTVVGEVIQTMTAINESSQKVTDIISVIDEIAFQTNILALNAAVEAARAGEQGRGFAVVATEVRNLSQRTSAAAKEIKILISKSVDNVASGSKLVDKAGETMAEILKEVKHVTEIMSSIATASVEQSSGIEQVNEAIVQMDQVTQQNSAMVEQAANAANSLEEQTSHMEGLVRIFKLNNDSSVEKIISNANVKIDPKKPIKKKQLTKSGEYMKTMKNEWEEF